MFSRTKYIKGRYTNETEAETAGREYVYSEVGRVYSATYVGTRQREDGSWGYIYTQCDTCD